MRLLRHIDKGEQIMCTSIISNRKKTIVGWNLDILDMEYQVIAEDDKVYIAVYD